MSAVCEDTGLSVAGCGHCRGITWVDLDSAKVPEDAPVQLAAVAARKHLARPAVDRLGQLLLDTAKLYVDLADGLAGTRSGGDGERVASTSVEAPLPVDTRVVEHRHLLVRGLRYWCSRTTLGGNSPVETVPRMVALLVHRLPDMSTEDQAELRRNLLDWRDGAGKVTSGPRLRGKLPLPVPCPNGDGELWSCDGRLDLLLPADKRQRPWLSCPACNARQDVQALPQAADVLLPVHEAAELLGVTVRTVQRRAARDGGYVRLGDVLPEPDPTPAQ